MNFLSPFRESLSYSETVPLKPVMMTALNTSNPGKDFISAFEVIPCKNVKRAAPKNLPTVRTRFLTHPEADYS
jgi:hypothetical protein